MNRSPDIAARPFARDARRYISSPPQSRETTRWLTTIYLQAANFDNPHTVRSREEQQSPTATKLLNAHLLTKQQRKIKICLVYQEAEIEVKQRVIHIARVERDELYP